MPLTPADTRLLELLAHRLERLSADSKWAHRASGLRGQVLRALGKLEVGDEVGKDQAQRLIAMGFDILRKAARDFR